MVAQRHEVWGDHIVVGLFHSSHREGPGHELARRWIGRVRYSVRMERATIIARWTILISVRIYQYEDFVVKGLAGL